MTFKEKIKSGYRIVKELLKPKNLLLEAIILASGVSMKEAKAQEALGEYRIHGQIRSGTTGQGIEGIEVKRILWREPYPTFVDSSVTITDPNGYFNTTFTDINDETQTQNLGTIKYYWNNIELPENANITLSNILGEEIYTQELKKGTHKINLDNLADGVYFTTIITQEIPITNKIIKITDNGILQYYIGAIEKQITKPTKKQKLQKNMDNAEYYSFDITDTTRTYYNQLGPAWTAWPITSTSIEHNTPLLEKKVLEHPFTHTGTGQPVNTTKDLLFFQVGTDVIPGNHTAYFNFVKPILTDLNIDELPAQYTETDIRAATNYMLENSGFAVNTTLWKETNTYINPFDTTNSIINYLYLNNEQMQGYDFKVAIFRRNDKTQSFELKFNKDTIEPEYIKKAVQLAWQFAVCSGVRFTPDNNYHSQGLRNNVNTMLPDEQKTYGYCFQQEHRMWIGPETITENNTSSTQPLKFQEPTSYQYKVKFTDKETIIEKEPINTEMYFQMRKQLEKH